MTNKSANPFPGLDYEIALPAGFEVSTSGNDVCPSMASDDKRLKVFLDYADTSRREINQAAPRFSVHGMNEDGDAIGPDGMESGGSPEQALLNTDDWAEVETFIAAHDPQQVRTTAP